MVAGCVAGGVGTVEDAGGVPADGPATLAEGAVAAGTVEAPPEALPPQAASTIKMMIPQRMARTLGDSVS